MCVYIYIYIERERYIYIYTHIFMYSIIPASFPMPIGGPFGAKRDRPSSRILRAVTLVILRALVLVILSDC